MSDSFSHFPSKEPTPSERSAIEVSPTQGGTARSRQISVHSIGQLDVRGKCRLSTWWT